MRWMWRSIWLNASEVMAYLMIAFGWSYSEPIPFEVVLCIYSTLDLHISACSVFHLIVFVHVYVHLRVCSSTTRVLFSPFVLYLFIYLTLKHNWKHNVNKNKYIQLNSIAAGWYRLVCDDWCHFWPNIKSKPCQI